MKRLSSFTLFLLLMVLMASVTIAAPVMITPEHYIFYLNGDHFGGGDIDDCELNSYNGLGMGAVIPLGPTLNVGLSFGSNDYSDNNFAIQASLLPKEDGYLYHFEFKRCGSDGSLTHFGVYHNFPGDDIFSLCGGGGASLVTISDADEDVYLSLFIELQAQMKFSEGFFGYAGVTYDYHLEATNLEIGVGMTI